MSRSVSRAFVLSLLAALVAAPLALADGDGDDRGRGPGPRGPRGPRPGDVERRRVRVVVPEPARPPRFERAPGRDDRPGADVDAGRRAVVRSLLRAWFAGGRDVPLAPLRDRLRESGWTEERVGRAIDFMLEMGAAHFDRMHRRGDDARPPRGPSGDRPIGPGARDLPGRGPRGPRWGPPEAGKRRGPPIGPPADRSVGDVERRRMRLRVPQARGPGPMRDGPDRGPAVAGHAVPPDLRARLKKALLESGIVNEGPALERMLERILGGLSRRAGPTEGRGPARRGSRRDLRRREAAPPAPPRPPRSPRIGREVRVAHVGEVDREVDGEFLIGGGFESVDPEGTTEVEMRRVVVRTRRP